MYWSLKASKSISAETSRDHVSAACLLHTFNVLFLLHRSQHLQAASHKACNCWQPPTATLPSSPLPLLFLPASKPGIKAHPTNWSPWDSQHHTCPQEKHTGPLLLLTVKKLCKEHGCLPTQLGAAPVPCNRDWEGASVATREPHITSRPST